MTFWVLLQLMILVLGLCLGSFLNVCIARMPEDRSIVSPPSHCPRCAAKIRWYDNIPIVSWLLLRARCRKCGHSISATYPLVEFCTGLLLLLLWRRLLPGPTYMDLPHLALFSYYLVFVCMLVALTFIDLNHHIIPDEFSIYAVPFGVLGAVGLARLDPPLGPGWQQSLLGATLGAGILLLIAGLYWLLRREEGIGMGDVKLLAMIGSFLGTFPALFMVLMLGSIIGSVVGIANMLLARGNMRSALPFGPFLALGALMNLYFGDYLAERLILGLLPPA